MAYSPPIGSIYHLYTTYILPSGGLYNLYHLLGEPETTIDHSSCPFPKDSLLFIEACCGCALLSSCVAKLGFEVMPIDVEGNKHRPYMHVIQLDLRKRETWQFLRYVAESRRPFHFHDAPPCGTASRA